MDSVIYKENNTINSLVKSLLPHQKLEISPNGEVKIVWREEKTGKKKFWNRGNIFSFISEIVPTKEKLWATPPQPGKRSFYKFGEKLPIRTKKDYDLDILLGIFQMFVDYNGKHDSFVDSQGFKYKVYSVKEIKGFYSEKLNSLSYIEYRGKKFYIPKLAPELKTQTFSSLEDVK